MQTYNVESGLEAGVGMLGLMLLVILCLWMQKRSRARYKQRQAECNWHLEKGEYHRLGDYHRL